MNNNSYGHRLRVARKAAGLTQRELGRLAGQAGTTIANIEQGNTQASTRTAALARALGVRPEWLEEGRGAMVPELRSERPEPRPAPRAEQRKAFTLDDIEMALRISSLPASKRAAVAALLAALETTETV